ncbi:glycosyltransferase family 2 protein [Trichocoleus sp. FACHB-591]|uniref:glycosyltransferase family 2 protein n=1 Tax=Trichocoleus sp. FACHB-591 TaxID=2692872 RepID=UPI0016898380|nr:glycosyltransferase [Trichocoleus sp. FACHB-591]MBD2093916.1 glycosyltransferase family 2 protein [Trichocoleus sp. FACHB-591]
MSQKPPIHSSSVEFVVIINSFNRLPLLKGALPSITQALCYISLNAAIVIFDAGSTDGSSEFIRAFTDQTPNLPIHCLYPPSGEGRSFSAGCNYAAKFAAQAFPQLKWLFFFETDNLIKNNQALPLAIQLLEEQEHLAAVGFTVERRSGEKAGFGSCFPTALGFVLGQQITQKLGLAHSLLSQWHPFSGTRWATSDTVFTSPLLVRYEAWQVVGEMDATTFPYSDCDHDWCWRAAKQDWHIAVLDTAGVVHDNDMQSSAWSSNRVVNFHQARLNLLLKHQGQWVLWLKPLLFCRHSLELILLRVMALYSKRAKHSFSQRQILLMTVLRDYKSL